MPALKNDIVEVGKFTVSQDTKNNNEEIQEVFMIVTVISLEINPSSLLTKYVLPVL